MAESQFHAGCEFTVFQSRSSTLLDKAALFRFPSFHVFPAFHILVSRSSTPVANSRNA